MAEVKSIELVFENCEMMRFDRSDIGEFCVHNIFTDVARIASNSIRKYQSCESLILELRKDANQPHDFWGIPDDEPTNKFNRIMLCPDITQIDITYDDGSTENIILPWEDASENGCNSTLQTHCLTECGDLWIKIGNGETAQDMVASMGDEVNDPEYNSFKWEMYTL